MNVVAIIQARMGSMRLPGKVLLDLAGKPMLAQVVERVLRAKKVGKVVVATSTSKGDEPIELLCQKHHWPCSRGSENDVLDRYFQAALAHQAEIVVRITSDCPLIEPEIIDLVVGDLGGGADYSSNVFDPRTYPRGLDVEAFPFATLRRLWHEDTNPAWREHVTELVHKRPEQFALRHTRHHQDLSGHRWTVDTPEDFELIKRIYEYFGHNRFSWHEVLSLLELYPSWLEINRAVEQKVI